MTPRTEPFFDALLQDRPDLDVVILPIASTPPLPPVTPAQSAAARAAVDHVVASAAAWLPGVRPTHAWAVTDTGRRPLAQLGGRAHDAFLDQLETALGAARWQVRRTRAAYERLIASYDGVEVIATYAAGGAATISVLGPVIGGEC